MHEQLYRLKSLIRGTSQQFNYSKVEYPICSHFFVMFSTAKWGERGQVGANFGDRL